MPVMTPLQIVGLLLITLSVLSGATTQLTDIFGSGLTKIIVSCANLGSAILGGWVMMLTGQSGLVQQVQAMPGVEKITVNKNANQVLAQLAMDAGQDKVEAAPGADAAVAATAKS